MIQNEIPFTPQPLARRDGPPESLAAADYMSQGERLGAAQALALDAVRRNPGRTAMELAALDGLSDPRLYNRRLVELERRGDVVRRSSVCSLTRRPAARWYPK